MTHDSDESTSKNYLKGVAILLGLAILFSFVTDNLLRGSVVFDLDMRPEDYLGVLTHIAIIALITERFVEIFTSVIRTPKRIELQGKVRRAVDEEKEDAVEVLEKYKGETGVFTITISFVTGLIIASVGIHVLGPLFDTSELTPTQRVYFDAIDIIITAGLISGGSKGVNSLTSSIGAVFDAMKYQSRATQSKAHKDMTET